MIKGISQNHSPAGTPAGYAFYGKNIVINRVLDEIINEKGTKLVEAFQSAGINKIVGVIPFNHKLIVFYNAYTYALVEKLQNGGFDNALHWKQTKLSPTHVSWAFSNGVASSSTDFSTPTAHLWQPLTLIPGTNITVSGSFTRRTSMQYLYGCFTDVLGNPIPNTNISIIGRNVLFGSFSKTIEVPVGAGGFAFFASGGQYVLGSGSTFQPVTLDNVSILGSTGAPVLGDKIGVYDELTGTFIEKLSRTDLGFSEYYPITGKAKLNSKEELIVAFTDKNKNPKYINLDTASSTDSLDLYNLSFTSRSPNIDTDIIEGGGSWKAGAHFISVQYVDKNKAAGNFSPFSRPVYIVQHPRSFDNSRSTQGTESGVNTSKAIRVTLTDLDPTFNTVNIAVLSKIQGNTTTAVYKQVSYTGSSVTTLLTGDEITTPITVEEAVTLNLQFEKVGEIESLNDQLFLADLTLAEVTNFQKLANRIKLEWYATYVRLPYSNLPKDGRDKGLMHDEVYAMYAQFELPNGTFTDWFHIPGKALTASDRAASTIAEEVKINGVTPKKFQIEDTATWNGGASPISDPNLPPPAQWGDFSKWENENEVYPDDFPDFAGEKVRHHKTPSVWYMRNAVYNVFPSASKHGITDWDLLGIRVSFPEIPAEFQGKFKGVRIGYAKRDVSNMTLLGYDIIQTGGNNLFDTGKVIPTTGNFHHNWQDEGIHLTVIENLPEYLRLHSPDLFIVKPPVENTYISNIVRVKIEDLNQLQSDEITAGRVVFNSNGTADPDVWTYVSDFTKSSQIRFVDNSERIRKLNYAKYVPANVVISDSDTTIENRGSEEFIHGKIANTFSMDFAITTNAFRQSPGQRDSPGLFEETLLTSIKSPKSDVFVAFTDQTVVPFNDIIRNFDGSTNILYQGDAFIALYSFVATMPAIEQAGDTSVPFADIRPLKGVRNIKAYLTESRFNLGQRYSQIDDYGTYFYPYNGGKVAASNREEYWTVKISQDNPNMNRILYDREFNAINEFEQYGIYKEGIDYTNELPFAIVRSQKASRATDTEDGWRIFLPNDIFYTVKDKGKITNLVAWGTDSLLIHHEFGLFKTRDKAVLQTDVTLVSLGSGEIFSLEPAEIMPTEYGYGGLQNKFGALLCEAGYIFIDASTGEIFQYGGGNNFQGISKGLRNLFEEVFRNQDIPDNPFFDGGVTLGFDKENYRIILSLKAQTSFTCSYDLIKEEWVSLHDYLPDFLVNTRKQLYSFKNSAIHEHNKGPVGSYYGTVYPSFVDIVVNNEPTQEKILSALTWFTKVVEHEPVNSLIEDLLQSKNKRKETLTHITVWNDHFCTGKIEIKQQTNIADYEGANTKKAAGGWRFNDLKDAVVDPDLPFVGGIFDDYRPISANIDNSLTWFERAELRGTYFIVRLEYSNLQNKSVSLRSLVPELKLSSE